MFSTYFLYVGGLDMLKEISDLSERGLCDRPGNRNTREKVSNRTCGHRRVKRNRVRKSEKVSAAGRFGPRGSCQTRGR